jgi:uncharacterized protein
MKPRITILTLGVDDLEKSLRFYRDGLGLASKGIIGTEFEHGAIALFELEGGMKLSLFPRDDLARDALINRTGSSPTEFSIGHAVSSKSGVDAVMESAKIAGAKIVKAAQDAFWGGYSGYFQDPDGHLLEVLWNPNLTISDS